MLESTAVAQYSCTKASIDLQVDAALLSSLKPEVKGYLSARFSLKKNDRPHLMAF